MLSQETRTADDLAMALAHKVNLLWDCRERVKAASAAIDRAVAHARKEGRPLSDIPERLDEHMIEAEEAMSTTTEHVRVLLWVCGATAADACGGVYHLARLDMPDLITDNCTPRMSDDEWNASWGQS